MRKNFIFFFSIMYLFNFSASASNGKKVFETYCWGCHHQTAVAFGPHFEEIASKRSADEIRAMITDPKSVSKVFGYKRNAMPAFVLSDENLSEITQYILSFKPDNNSSKKETEVIKLPNKLYFEYDKNKSREMNETKELNKTIIEKPYQNLASRGVN